MTGGGGLRRGGLTLLLACACGALPAALPPLVWPTPNRAWLDGRGIAEYIQPTVSGDPASGLFGGWRSGGNQFHGGVDLLPVSRDARGEAADPVFAAMPGVVRHTNTRAGDSSYGRYIVIEHTGTEPAALTLYAHLAAVSVAPGDVVKAGQVVGKMGRSAGGYSIPRERAHLHFEICLRLTDNFQAWYDRQKFGSPNKHGVWNGLNMARLDPLAFLNACREGRTRGLAEWLRGMEEAARVRVAAARTPDFVTRYPALADGGAPLFPPRGWEVSLDWTGLPFRWRPLGADEVRGLRPGEWRLVATNGDVLRRERSKRLAVLRRGKWVPGRDLVSVMERLFGPR